MPEIITMKLLITKTKALAVSIALSAVWGLVCPMVNGQLIPPAGGGSGIVSSANAENMGLIFDVEDGFVSLFNGQDLDGWDQKNGTAVYEVKDGTILGTTVVGSPNSFLCSEKEYSDFDLRFEVKVDVGLNSGVQIRSLSKPGYQKGRVHGPQVEIESDPGEAGYIYSEATGRGWVSPTRVQRNVFKNDDWNRYRVLADGSRIQVWINGHMIEDLEMPAVESTQGFFGLQVHSIPKNKGPFKVQWQNIRIKELDGSETRTIEAINGTPVVDGKIDDAWKNVPRLITDRKVEDLFELEAGQTPSTAWVKCMWDDGHLYCLAEVTDSKINGEAENEWDRDGVEFFVDGNMARSSQYDFDDAQYRTEPSGNNSAGPSSNLENYQSAVTKTETGYIVEACFKLDTSKGKEIGFDVQVNNDPGDGRRRSTMKWNDSTNEAHRDASVFGTLEMVEKK
ncbi:MAG: hypothetical protein ACI87E_000949 [Mariniblastus sp.]